MGVGGVEVLLVSLLVELGLLRVGTCHPRRIGERRRVAGPGFERVDATVGLRGHAAGRLGARAVVEPVVGRRADGATVGGRLDELRGDLLERGEVAAAAGVGGVRARALVGVSALERGVVALVHRRPPSRCVHRPGRNPLPDPKTDNEQVTPLDMSPTGTPYVHQAARTRCRCGSGNSSEPTCPTVVRPFDKLRERCSLPVPFWCLSLSKGGVSRVHFDRLSVRVQAQGPGSSSGTGCAGDDDRPGNGGPFTEPVEVQGPTAPRAPRGSGSRRR